MSNYYRHNKTGGVYMLIDTIESDLYYSEDDTFNYYDGFFCSPVRVQRSYKSEVDLPESLVIYMSKTYDLWARPEAEFFDGRFTDICP